MSSDDTTQIHADHPQGPWIALEAMPGLSACRVDWRKWAGAQFDALWALCLQSTDRFARSYTCPRHCGCAHYIIMRHDRTSAVAACRCNPPHCPDIPVTLEDITPLELTWTRLGRALSRAFGFNSRFTKLSPPTTVQFGAYGPDQVPAILTIQFLPAAFRSVVAELVAVLHKPFMLFAPTGTMLDAPCHAMLENCGAAFFPLDTTVFLKPDGTLLPARPPSELFARFTPQPKELDEDTARKAFALVKALDSEANTKPPTPATIFVHFCVDGLTVAETARRCGCSRGTVLNRLALIRKRTGVAPEHLRTLSGHLARLENTISDPRASHIHRARLTDDSDDTDPD